MLSHMPVVLGLTLCEDVVVDPATGNVSLIRSFTGLPVDNFPAVARPFCAFAALSDGEGEVDAELLVNTLEGEGTEAYQVSHRLRFTDRLQIVYYVRRFSRCPLPIAGVYLFTLNLNGEWAAQRTLRVYPAGTMP